MPRTANTRVPLLEPCYRRRPAKLRWSQHANTVLNVLHSPRLLLTLMLLGPTAMVNRAEAQSSSAASLIEARLTGVQDVTRQPGVPCICDDQGNVMFDGSYRLTFSPIRTLAGAEFFSPVTVDQASARPIAGYRYLILLERSGDKTVVLWRGLRKFGLCAEDEYIAKYGLAKMAKRFRCRD